MAHEVLAVTEVEVGDLAVEEVETVLRCTARNVAHVVKTAKCHFDHQVKNQFIVTTVLKAKVMTIHEVLETEVKGILAVETLNHALVTNHHISTTVARVPKTTKLSLNS